MTGLDPDVAATRAAVRDGVADLAPGSLLLVACSGGPDSLALASAAAFVAPRMGLRAGAVSVDHGLQPGSGAVADAAARACRDLGLEPVWVERVTVAGPGGVEAAARRARYAALESAAWRTAAACVLLGHTLDDQAETVLLALARGSGARSLAGMRAARGVHRRPFLRLRRSETAAACEALGLLPWRDPTNERPVDSRRAAVRHDLLPVLARTLGPGAVPALARTADLLRDDADLLDALAADLLRSALRERGEDLVVLDADVLAAAPAALRGRALRRAAVDAGCPAGALGAVHVDALTGLLTQWHGQGPLDLPGGVSAGRRCGRLSLGVIDGRPRR